MARSLNGTSDFISVGTSSILNPATISISAWMYNDEISGERWIAARDDNTLGRAYAFGVSSSSLKIQVAGAVNDVGGGVSASVWTHCGVTGPGAAWIVYVNGSGTNTGDATAMGSATGATTIGKRTYSGFEGFFQGNLAEVAQWDVILTAAEMASLARGYSPLFIRPSNLLAYWPLVRTLTDSVGGFTGAATGTSVFPHTRIIMPDRRRRTARTTAAPTQLQFVGFMGTSGV